MIQVETQFKDIPAEYTHPIFYKTSILNRSRFLLSSIKVKFDGKKVSAIDLLISILPRTNEPQSIKLKKLDALKERIYDLYMNSIVNDLTKETKFAYNHILLALESLEKRYENDQKLESFLNLLFSRIHKSNLKPTISELVTHNMEFYDRRFQ